MKVNKREIGRMVLVMKERYERVVLTRLQDIGEQFVTNARTSANFKDQTGNLRSSIGYVILKNGLQLSGSGWVLIREGHEGIVAGQRLLKEMAAKFPTGIVLICVAGMDYAAAVEAKGYDVITSSAIAANQEFIKEIDRLKAKIKSGN